MKTLTIILIILLAAAPACEKNQVQIKVDYQIKTGAQFQLSLDSNSTTGFSWQWKNRQEISIVDTIGWNYIPKEPVLIGSGGTEIWTFKGIARGTDTLILAYCRSWEPDSAAFTKQIVVKVK